MSEIAVSVVVALFTALAGSIVLVLVIALPFRWLWNAIVVVEFCLPRVDYLQAAGLLALVALTSAAASGVRIALKFRRPR